MYKGITEAELRTKYNEEVQNLRYKIQKKDEEIAFYRREHGVLETFFRNIREAIAPIKPQKILYKSKEKRSVVSPCSIVMQINDGHHGMIQQADEIEGFGEYNPEISRKRQLQYANDLIRWVTVKRHGYCIDELVCLVLGDMISGDIHDDLLKTNAWPSPVQSVEAGKLLAEQIMLVAKHFPKVRVEFISEDNHARLTKKPQAKEAGLNSLNYVVGEVTKAYLRDQNNIEFNLYPMYEKVISVRGRQYLISHGHSVRGWMGVPMYGIERKVGKESIKRLAVIMEDIGKMKKIGFHKYVFGHWHMPFQMPHYLCGGSVSGTDANDHKNGRYSIPSQKAWAVHPKRGEFDWTDFRL